MRKIVLSIICMLYFPYMSFAQESSILVSENTQIQKKHGFQQSLFLHETNYINPFSEYQIIVEKDEDTVLGYRVGGEIFNQDHFLFIEVDANEDKKTMQGWQSLQEGIYKKIILQQASYDLIDGIYTPNQSVAATTYYRVLYNYDTTPGICGETIFSHDSAGIKRFELANNTWVNTEKYIYYSCFDNESGCECESSNPNCFIKDTTIFTTPKSVGHNGIVSSDFTNSVGLASTCNSSEESKILYDTLSPDMNILLNDVVIDTSDMREYISNDGVLYDGQQIPEKRFYNLKDTISLRADSNTKMHFELFDIYDALKTLEGVSGLTSYSLSLSKNTNGIWSEIGKIDENLDNYNNSGTKQQTDTQLIMGEDISFLKNAFTKTGLYQIYISFKDAAGNKARIVVYFNIVPDSVDASRSYMETSGRDSIFADDINYYDYSMYLRDKYDNPIKNKEVYNLEYTCADISGCVLLRQNMLTTVPSGAIGVEIFDQNLLSDDEGKISFKVKSFAPGAMTESFSFEMFDWNELYENIVSVRVNTHIFGAENNFLQPFSGVLETFVNSAWGNEIPLGEEIGYRMQIQENTSKVFDGEISDFTNFIISQEEDSNFTLTGELDFNTDGNTYFSGTMDTTLTPNEYHKIGLEISNSETSAIEISYVLSGKQIRHYLSGTQMHTYPVGVKKYVGTLTNPVKIIGNLQGVGNTQNSFERQNMSDISSSVMRNKLRKNISLSMRARKHDTIVGGVKYIDATKLPNNRYNLEANPNFKTLVVHNGNLHINSDLVSGGDMLGLISYVDIGYNVQDGYQDIGNIYIDNQVGQIQAAIYADGGLISSDNATPILGNSSSRSSLLQRQLYIKGALFTRNTLGGATLNGGKYILPGGESTSNQQLAMQYDFHHIRRGASNCLQESGTCKYNEYFIIEYDPRINNNPPELFSQ